MTDEKAEGEAPTSESSVEQVEATEPEPAPEANGEEESADTPAEEAETAAAAEETPDEVVISIGEEAPPPREEPAPAWVRELRKTNRELARKNRELEARLQSTSAPAAPQQVVVGKKPTLEDADYDAERFERSLAEWFDRKRRAEEIEGRQKAEQERQQKEWQARLAAFEKAKSELRVSDFDEANEAFLGTFDVYQQVAIIHAADNPHHVIYALGKSPQKAKELAAIKDPAKFAFAAGKLEAQLKVTSRKPAAAPEKPVSGTGRVSGAVDSTLEKLRAEAEKTGNYSKVIAYKNQRRGG